MVLRRCRCRLRTASPSPGRCHGATSGYCRSFAMRAKVDGAAITDDDAMSGVERCFLGCWAMLPPARAGAASEGRRCRHRPSVMLLKACGDATSGRWHCYQRPPTMLRTAAGGAAGCGATEGRRRCSERQPAVLPAWSTPARSLTGADRW
jgi:hypothetical protein